MNWRFRTIASVLGVFFFIPAFAFGQNDGALRGIVTAGADRSLLPQVEIEILSPSLVTPLRTRSANDGSFAFQRLVPGIYTVRATHDGFQPRQIELSLKPREIQNIAIELSVQGITQSIDVKSTVLTETYSPSSTLVQRQVVDDLPADQKNNLPDMIVAAAPGMIRSHDDFVHVRGSEIALNTFINGVSFWENPHTVFSSGVTPDIIQTANVITGGFPAEYGNRFGGVIDVVTKSGLSMNNEGAVTLGAGNALRNNATVEWGGHTDRAGLFVYSSGFESARFLSPNDPRSIHDTGRGMHNFLQFDFSVNPKDAVKFVVMADGSNFQIPKTSIDDQLRPNVDANQRTRAQSAVLTWSHAFSANSWLASSLYERWSRTRLFPASDPLASFAQNDRKLLTAGFKSDLTQFRGRHTIKSGVDLVLLRPDENLYFYGEGYVAFSHLAGLHHVHLRGPDRGPITFADQQTGGQISAYVQDSLQLARKLTLDAGVRYDGYSLATSATHFSPRLNLAYRLSDAGTIIHASYNHFFVPPAIENVLISSAGLTRFLQDHPEPLPPLQPIVENQVELGITQPIHDVLRAGVSAYYRLSNNPVHTVLFPDSRIYAYANFDKGKAYGMEIKLDSPALARFGVRSYLNYALSRTYFWNPVTAGFVDEAHHLEDTERFLAPMDQTHTLNAGITYHHRRSGLWGGMTFEYGSGTPTEVEDETATVEPAPLRVPGHFTQNLTMGADLFRNRDRSWISLQFNIENLTNTVYKISQENTFSPGEYSNPRFYSASMKVHF